jgi:hypothetical protein
MAAFRIRLYLSVLFFLLSFLMTHLLQIRWQQAIL